MIMLAVTGLVFGLVIGSFLNVCIYRLPRELSIVNPPSSCPNCKTPIKPWDNIPVISYILLAGKCRKCSQKISLRYPSVELLNGLLYAAAAYQFGWGWHLPLICALISSMILITFIDLDFQIIPDAITLPGMIIGLASSHFIMPDPFSMNALLGFTASVIGLLAGGVSFYLIALLSRGGMGGGDVKMMAMLGSFLGWKGVFLTTLLGSLLGSLIGIALIVFKGKGRKTKVPFGPFLALGSLVALFFGRIILDWYFPGRIG
ncbi:MAG TPA: prepilin peptidase [Dissulfurispiraceae bacterium]|nr:prepilin peptidase [Dissulfurispiraceae bacterium]